MKHCIKDCLITNRTDHLNSSCLCLVSSDDYLLKKRGAESRDYVKNTSQESSKGWIGGRHRSGLDLRQQREKGMKELERLRGRR